MTITLFQLVSCNRKNLPIDTLSIQDIGTRIYGEKFGVKENVTAEYSIIFKKEKKDFGALFQDVYYSVIEHSTNEIVWTDTLSSGSVNWKGEYIIQASSATKKSGKYVKEGYTFSVLSRQKI